jgi:hypothetical protein
MGRPVQKRRADFCRVVDKGKAAEEYYVVRNLCQQYWQENKQPS